MSCIDCVLADWVADLPMTTSCARVGIENQPEVLPRQLLASPVLFSDLPALDRRFGAFGAASRVYSNMVVMT